MSETKRYLRFPLPRRIEHWLNAISFITLALTGLPQKYPDNGGSLWFFRTFGGIETVRIIHRISAIVLAGVAIWHIGFGIYHWYVRRKSASILLGKEDGVSAWQTLLYNIGRRRERPKQGFYTFEEKIEYWALMWGTGVMVITGFFLWNPITAARFLPGGWIPAAKAAHGGEALLAVLSILVWHLYHTLVRTFNKSMYTGYMSAEEMEHEHPLALHEPPPLKMDPTRLSRRKRQFWIGYGLAATVWLFGVFWFVTSETTATATIPEKEPIELYVPLTPTPFAAGYELTDRARQLGTTWDDGIGQVISSRCGECHNPVAGEKNLDLTSLEGALQGGDSGPAVVPGAPGISPVLIWPDLGDHPGTLSQAEKAAVWHWILNGAPEQ